MGNYKLYCKKVSGNNEGLVYLYLYNLPSGTKVPTLHSLKIKVPRDYLIFEPNSNYAFKRVKKNLPNEYLLKTGFESVSKLNSFIEEKLENFIKIDGKKEFIEKENKTLNHWFKILISGMYNQGTILRYTNVLNLLEMYQLSTHSTKIIYLKDINSDFVFSFRNWLLTDPIAGQNRKRNSLNSTNYKLKCLKSVINKCHLNNYYNFIVNPFDHIKLKELHFPIEVLTFDELQRLINTELVEVYRRKVPTKDGVSLWGKPIEGGVEERNKKNQRYKCKHTLNEIRTYFLFQLYSQGIRVSDMITLKWTHFKQADNNNLRILKVMMKTKEPIRILVNNNMLSLLSPQITRYKSELNNLEFEKIESINYEIDNINKRIKKKSYLSVKKHHLMWEFIEDKYKEILCNIENLGTEKIENTQFEVYYISKEQLDEVYIIMNTTNTIDDYNRNENIEELNNLIEEYDLKIKDPSISEDFRENHNTKRARLGRQIKKQFLSLLYNELDLTIKSKNQKNIEHINKLYEKRNLCLTKLISSISIHNQYKNDFVFPLLNKKDFEDIHHDDYSRINSNQYKKFQSVRTYYNGLLKIISDQCSLNKKLTSHTARHTFTSLMLEMIDNVSPYDIMNSLGHKNISTTQIYMKRFSDKNVDRLNLMVPNVLGYI
jgi:integrase